MAEKIAAFTQNCFYAKRFYAKLPLYAKLLLRKTLLRKIAAFAQIFIPHWILL
jgi:hypothetical protein